MHTSCSFTVNLLNLYMPLVAFPRHEVMEIEKRKFVTQKEVTRASNVKWKTLNQCAILLEEEEYNSDNNKFYMPPTSPLKSISKEIKSCIRANCGKRHSKILLIVHENTMHKVLNAKIPNLYQPSYVYERLINYNLMNEPSQISTSKSRVVVNSINIKGGHVKQVWLFKIYKYA